MVIFLWLSQDGDRGNIAAMNIALALLGIGINLAGIALQVSPYQNIWLTLICAFVGGGCFFLGLFGNRRAPGSTPLIERLYPDVINGLVLGGALVVTAVVLIAISTIYHVYERKLDIEAAKAGVSTPSPAPTPKWPPDNR